MPALAPISHKRTKGTVCGVPALAGQTPLRDGSPRPHPRSLLCARRVSALPLRVPQLNRHGFGENGFMQGSDTSTPICGRTASFRASRTPTPSCWPSAHRTCWRKSAPGTPRGNNSSRRPSRRSSSATGGSGIGGARYRQRAGRSPLGLVRRDGAHCGLTQPALVDTLR
jgi:hypothetical protein